MKTKIGFFSVGFAFNRLVRLRYYENIFPTNTELFLFTTNKYHDQDKWKLSRTKIVVLKHNPLLNAFQIRRICKENGINIFSNLGHPFGAIPLIIASAFTKTKILLYILGDSIDYPKLDTFTKSGLKYLFSLIPYFIIEKFCTRTAFVGYNSYKKAPLFFLSPKNKFHYLHAPVNTDIFSPISRQKARNKLKISQNDKLIVYVGRITRRKGGRLLSYIIKSNPEIKFILIGKWLDKEIPKFKARNLIHIESLSNDKLPAYYSAADLVFAYHRQGCQIGIVGEEALACGTPVLHTNRIHAKNSEAIIKVPDNTIETNKKIKDFFALPKDKKIKISKEARLYAEKYLSDEVWKDKYLDFFLK